MSKIIFHVGKYEIKVRDILIVLSVLLLFLFLYFSTRDAADSRPAQIKRIQLVEMIETDCDFPIDNVDRLHKILLNSDICDEAWLNEYQELIIYFKEQALIMKDKGNIYKAILTEQNALIQSMEAFYEKQGSHELQDLKEHYMRYEKQAVLYQGGCHT